MLMTLILVVALLANAGPTEAQTQAGPDLHGVIEEIRDGRGARRVADGTKGAPRRLAASGARGPSTRADEERMSIGWPLVYQRQPL